MVDYKKSLLRPFLDWKKFLLGSAIILGFLITGILITVPFSLISAFMTNQFLGLIVAVIVISIMAIPIAYFVRCGIMASKGDFSIPRWNGILKLIKTGLIIAIISFVYYVPSLIITPIITDAIIGNELSNDIDTLSQYSLTDQQTSQYIALETDVNQRLLPKLPLLIPIVVLISLVFFVITTAATLHFMSTEKFSDAFSFKRIFKIAFSSLYIITTLILVLIMIPLVTLGAFIVFFLSLYWMGLLLIPVIIAIFAYIISMITYTILGQAYGAN